MKQMDRVFRKRFWFTLAFVVMLTVMASGPLFAADFDTEEESLLYMREEEKLARDVYLALYDRWQLAIFKNISTSELRHMDAIKTLLVRYGVPDPALDPGKFTNPNLQLLYDALIIQGDSGDSSVTDALNVGVLIEETDIEDLLSGIAIARHNDIKRVYQNLMAGSENHWAAFQSVLSNY